MDGRDKPDHDTRDNLGDGRKPQPLTCTLTVCAAPEVAPLRSATITSKLAACVLVPSCVKDTLPRAPKPAETEVSGVVTLSFGTRVVMVGLVPTIHPTASSGARGWLDPRDKPEDDAAILPPSTVVTSRA